MRFLLLNQAFYPDVVSTAQHLADAAAGLAARGHTVTVITSRRAYDNPGQFFPRNEIWRGVRVLRVGGTGFGKESKWRRVLDFISFSLLCGCRGLFLPAQDVVVALTTPPLIALAALGLARLWRGRFVYWVMDLNPDQATAAGWLRAGSRTAQFLEWLSRLTLERADRVIALDRFMFARLRAKGVSPARMSVLPPWSHDNAVHFDAVGRHRFRKRHGLGGKFVVMYSGNHSPCHPLNTILAAARELAEDREIVFCFVGGGTEFRKIRSSITTNSSSDRSSQPIASRSNLLCLPYQPLCDLSASLSAADLHLAVLGEGFVGLVHPCKIYNILRIGTPVVYIGPVPSSVSEVLAQADGRTKSACLSHGDVSGLVTQIQRIRKESIQFGHSDTPALSQNYSQERLLGDLLAVLEASDLSVSDMV